MGHWIHIDNFNLFLGSPCGCFRHHLLQYLDYKNILSAIWIATVCLFSLGMIMIKAYTVEPPRKGHFGTNINSSGLSPLYLYRGCPLLRGSNRIILIGRDKFGDLVSSIVERYLIQCPFLGGSSLRGSTVIWTSWWDSRL